MPAAEDVRTSSIPSGNDSSEDSGRPDQFVPDAWQAAWAATQNSPLPSMRVKEAAEKMIWAEQLQQGLGWLVITQVGILFGMATNMSEAVFWLNWSIFTLEAGMKLGRSWAHSYYFDGVPCSYVMLHHVGKKPLVFFRRMLTAATLFELLLYILYSLAVVQTLISFLQTSPYPDIPSDCTLSVIVALDEFELSYYQNQQYGTRRMVELLVVASVITWLHWVSSLYATVMFVTAMRGGGSISRENDPVCHGDVDSQENLPLGTAGKNNSDVDVDPSLPLTNPNSASRTSGDAGLREDDFSHRLLWLTWWVHLGKHPYLSAAVASSQPETCGLEGQWFETVPELKRILEASTAIRADSQAHVNSVGPVWSSQEMAMTAFVSVAYHADAATCKLILQDNGFQVLLVVLSDGKPEACRGLAAVVIGELVSKECVKANDENLNLPAAIQQLMGLSRSGTPYLQERAFGALLNIALKCSRFGEFNLLSGLRANAPRTGSERTTGDEQNGSSSRSTQAETFLDFIMENAYAGLTMRCQVLAAGVLACLVKWKETRSLILPKIVGYLQMFIRRLKDGLTPELRASAAGLLWELAYYAPRMIGDETGCIEGLVEALGPSQPPQVAGPAAGALASVAFKNRTYKSKILSVGGSVIGLVERSKVSGGFGRVDHPHSSDEMKQAQENAQVQAVRAMWVLAMDNKESQRMLLQNGAIPALVGLLRIKSRNVYISMQASLALHAVAHKNPEIQDEIGSEFGTHEGFLALTDLLLNPERDIPKYPPRVRIVLLENVSLAIRSIALGHPANRQLLLSAHARDRLQTVLDYYSSLSAPRGSNNQKLSDLLKKALAALN